jgi:hypothetical protein
VPRALFPAVLLAVLLAGGCADSAPSSSSSSSPAPAEPTSTTPTSPVASPTASPTPEPEQSTGQHQSRGGGKKVAPTPLVARRNGARQHLLTARRLPALGGGLTWTVTGTAAETPDPTGACQKTALVDIGALLAVRREYAGPDGSGVAARQTVARFADRKSASRAEQVLRSWRDGCATWLDYPRKDVGPLAELTTDTDAAAHYRLSYGTRRAQDAAGTGIVRSGTWLTLVEITADSEDYPTDWNPARRAARRIAATFA